MNSDQIVKLFMEENPMTKLFITFSKEFGATEEDVASVTDKMIGRMGTGGLFLTREEFHEGTKLRERFLVTEEEEVDDVEVVDPKKKVKRTVVRDNGTMAIVIRTPLESMRDPDVQLTWMQLPNFRCLMLKPLTPEIETEINKNRDMYRGACFTEKEESLGKYINKYARSPLSPPRGKKIVFANSTTEVDPKSNS